MDSGRILVAMVVRLLILLMACAGGLPNAVMAQTTEASEALAEAERAYETGAWSQAWERAQAVLEIVPTDREALLLGARLALFTDAAAPAEARRLLRRAGDDSVAIDLALWYRYRHGGTFLPVFRDMARERATRQALRHDSLRGIPNLIAGLQELDALRASDGAVQLPVRFTDGNGIDTWLGLVDLRLADGRVSLYDSGVTGDEAPLVYDASASMRHREAAMHHLLLALQYLDEPGLWLDTVRGFAEVALYGSDHMLGLGAARRLSAEQPASAWGPVYETLFLYLDGQYTAAADAAERALVRMSDNERLEWQDLDRVRRPREVSSGRASDDWLDRDPRWSTPGNEAQAEVMARMAMADLLFGDPRSGRQGWETDPGKVIVRYGMYQERVRTTSDRDAFLVLHYGSEFFVFHDMAKSGEWIFYSSSAADLQGPRSVSRQWARDFTIRSRERFDARPTTSDVDAYRTDVLKGTVYRLGNGADRVLVAAYCMNVPIGTEGDVGLELLHAAKGTDVDPSVVAHWTMAPADFGACAPKVTDVVVPGDADRVAFEATYGGRWSSIRKDLPARENASSVMSDLIPASLIEHDVDPAEWPDALIREGRAIVPLVEPRVASGAGLSIYFELEGMQPDTPVRIEAILVEVPAEPVRRRWFDRPEAARVSVAFEDRAEDRRLARDFILSTETVAPGTYVVAVRVTDLVSGDTFEQSSPLTIY